MRTFLIALILLCLHCGPTKPSVDSVESTSDLQAFVAKVKLYSELAVTEQDNYGFIMTNACDALMFSALYAAAMPQLNINIAVAREDGDLWNRRPNHDCSPTLGTAHSTISRDMMLGVMWWMWRTKQLDLAVSLMETLRANSFMLPGEGTIGELLFIPSYVSTLAEIIYKLGGPNYQLERLFPAIITTGNTFIRHLAVWQILLRGELFQAVTEVELLTLKEAAKSEPNNPLYQAAYHKYLDGDYSSVLKLVMNEDEWPNSELPTSQNHCEPWPIQRDFDDPNDWHPCQPIVTHPGAELAAILYLVILEPQEAE